jgi:neutral trehalase
MLLHIARAYRILPVDYPYGWAPHQIMTWVGMERYGFQEDAQRLAYRWIYMYVNSCQP